MIFPERKAKHYGNVGIPIVYRNELWGYVSKRQERVRTDTECESLHMKIKCSSSRVAEVRYGIIARKT